MQDRIELHGVVLETQPIGEYDRRVVILTREIGKITAFARGARRPKSAMIAQTNPFVFAAFSVYEGKSAYTLAGAEAVEYFSELPMKMPGVLYGYYFLELASYYGREGIPAQDTVNLIYTALKAIMKEQMPPELIRRIYEIRTLVINGDYAPPSEPKSLGADAWYALRYVSEAPYQKLFAFTLSEEGQHDFASEADAAMRRTVDRKFKTLAVIREML